MRLKGEGWRAIIQLPLAKPTDFYEDIAAIICLLETFSFVLVKTEWEDKMAKLTTEQLLYLLYASAYLDTGTVTKSVVKSYLTKAWKEDVDEIYQALQQQHLIESAGRGRFAITERGEKALIANLGTTDYQFDSVKGPKVLNALLKCLGEAIGGHPQFKSSETMTFAEFEKKFQKLYFEERNRQELRGVVAIHSQELCRKFIEENSISQEDLDHYFELLKSTGKIFSVIEKGNELIQWVE